MLTNVSSLASFNRFVSVIVDGKSFEAFPTESILDFFNRNEISLPQSLQGKNIVQLGTVVADPKKGLTLVDYIAEGLVINTKDLVFKEPKTRDGADSIDNITLWRRAMKINTTRKVAVVDITLCHLIEKELKLPEGSMTYDKLAILLKNMGFDYLLDQGLITDYKIVKDAARIHSHHSQGFQQTIGSFNPAITRKILEYPPTPAEKVVEFLTSPELDVTTFVITDSVARREEGTFYMNNPDIYLSVGVTTQEFLKILKEDNPSLKGQPCEVFPLGSAQGAWSVTSERFAQSVVSTFGKNFVAMRVPDLEFKNVTDGIKIAEFPVVDDIKAQVATIDALKDLDKLYDLNYKNLIYISPSEKKSKTLIDALPAIDHESTKRHIKLAQQNPEAVSLWHKFLKEIDDEKFIKKKKEED
ncbi:hypothetical protein TVAG_255980 [Trichomonas vaginalis G3]|uniref:Uncharacterized protein n=1 Tax=Trichomonas vaginalis (strain ATCC PRA-98 / G3) TaxID=412133 RepID=A2DYZ5_TRIV3|nr:Fe-only hydrogenase family [Trichomonas vaginalis G3]EAY14406.1 hypothetical protein TVAG_255980 [Trichomonas vaginalis G3]KAI5501235.1 Fe-only hydrogenase family [Trichomonas vaginalis G3]|eukprot:XP_001326629.1 hypothetical protein [Trichomonas vaginalis G3]